MLTTTRLLEVVFLFGCGYAGNIIMRIILHLARKCGGLIPGKRYAHLEDQSWRNLGGLMQGRRKLNPEQITRARTLVGQGATRTHVARLMGATTTTISNAVDRKRAYRDT